MEEGSLVSVFHPLFTLSLLIFEKPFSKVHITICFHLDGSMGINIYLSGYFASFQDSCELHTEHSNPLSGYRDPKKTVNNKTSI
jgi:hypothetical protein